MATDSQVVFPLTSHSPTLSHPTKAHMETVMKYIAQVLLSSIDMEGEDPSTDFGLSPEYEFGSTLSTFCWSV